MEDRFEIVISSPASNAGLTIVIKLDKMTGDTWILQPNYQQQGKSFWVPTTTGPYSA